MPDRRSSSDVAAVLAVAILLLATLLTVGGYLAVDHVSAPTLPPGFQIVTDTSGPSQTVID